VRRQCDHVVADGLRQEGDGQWLRRPWHRIRQPIAVTVVLCKANTWPCASNQIAETLTATANSGNGSYSVASGIFASNTTVWDRANQTETSLWVDYSAVAGPVST
jgi:hypothetical protein